MDTTHVRISASRTTAISAEELEHAKESVKSDPLGNMLFFEPNHSLMKKLLETEDRVMICQKTENQIRAEMSGTLKTINELDEEINELNYTIEDRRKKLTTTIGAFPVLSSLADRTQRSLENILLYVSSNDTLARSPKISELLEDLIRTCGIMVKATKEEKNISRPEGETEISKILGQVKKEPFINYNRPKCLVDFEFEVRNDEKHKRTEKGASNHRKMSNWKVWSKIVVDLPVKTRASLRNSL